MEKKRHVVKALEKMSSDAMRFIEIKNAQENGKAPIVCFTIQSDPIKEVGVNGVQAVDMLEYVKFLFESLNESFSSHYNETSIAHIENAIQAQHLRTKDRIKRGVEGQNKI